jgi:hypothetical protein
VTYPGFQNQQAAHRAQISAQQQAYARGRPRRRIGVLGLIGRLVGLVITLAFVAVALVLIVLVVGHH